MSDTGATDRPTFQPTDSGDSLLHVYVTEGWPQDYNRVPYLRLLFKRIRQDYPDASIRQVGKLVRASSHERAYGCPDPKGEYSLVQCDSNGFCYARANPDGEGFYVAPKDVIKRITYVDLRGAPFPGKDTQL